MRVKIVISDDSEIGPLSEEERAGLERLRAVFAEGMEIDEERLNTGTAGWFGAAERGASAIGQKLMAETRHPNDELRRLAAVIHPWVEPGAFWEPFQGHYHYFQNWKITFRAWEALEGT